MIIGKLNFVRGYKMKVLFITDKAEYENRMMPNHKVIMSYVGERYDVVDKNDVVDYAKYDIIVNDGWTSFSDKIINEKGKRVLIGKFYEDLWQIYDAGERNIATEYDFVINRYHDLKTVNGLFCEEVKKFYIPHHFDFDEFQDWGMEKKFDMFVYGFPWRKLYPWRWKMFKLIKRELSNHFNIDRLRHPGYGDNCADKAVRSSELSKRINQAWLGFCTSESHGPYNKRNNPFDFWYMKYHETSLSGTVVLGTMPEEAKYVYQDDYIHVDNKMGHGKIIDTVGEALSDKEKLKQMAKRVHQRYRDEKLEVKYYTDKLNAIFKGLLDDS
jgi:hypothetical protein